MDVEPKAVKILTIVVNDVTGFLGNADVQKIIGLAGGAGFQTTVHTWAAKLASLGAGGLFTLGVHYIDYLRAKVATPRVEVVTKTPTMSSGA